MVTRKSEGQRSPLVRIIKKYHKRALANFFRGQREDQLQEMMLGENLAPATVAMYLTSLCYSTLTRMSAGYEARDIGQLAMYVL